MYIRKDKKNFYDKLNEKIDKIKRPKGLARWFDDFLFEDEMIMFIHKISKGYIGSCQHCKNDNIILAKVKHNELAKCPICKKTIRYRNDKYSKRFISKNYFSLFFKMNNGYVLRNYRVIRESDCLNYIYNLEELERCYVADDFLCEDWFRLYMGKWSLGCYKNMNFELPLHLWLYPGNLRFLSKNNELKYCQLYSLSKNIPINPILYLKKYLRLPQLEFVVKLGLFNYIHYLVDYNVCCSFIDFSAKVPNKFFKLIKPLYFNFLINKKVTFNYLPGLQLLEHYNVKPNKEYIQFAKYCCDLMYNPLMNEVIDTFSFVSFYNYINLNVYDNDYKDGLKHSIRDYLDYYEDCKYLNLNMKDTMYLKPHDFEGQHLKFSRRVSELKAKLFDDECNNVLLTLQNLNYSSSGYSIVVPMTAEDIRSEGNNLCHCVGGYVSRVAEGKSIIVFLRKCKDLNKPYYTVELNPLTKKIVQCRDYKNRHTGNSKIQLFLDNWIKDCVKVNLCSLA